MEFNTITYITTSTTTHIATSGSGIIHTVIIPITTTGTVTFKSVAASAVTYFVLPAATIAGSYLLDGTFSNGLDITTSASDVVIVTTGQ